MKRNAVACVLSFLVVFACVAFSCSENDLNLKQNVLIINGVSHPITQLYSSRSAFTDPAGIAATQFILALPTAGVTYKDNNFTGSGSVLYVQLVAAESTSLRPGLYTYQEDEVLFPVLLSGELAAIENPDAVSGVLVAGSVTVSKPGTDGVIQFNLTVSSETGEHTVSGYYKGVIP